MTIRSRPALWATAALAAALSCTATVAQTVYKLIDKSGKVTYSEKPPKDFPGQVIRMDIDPNANTATLPKATAPARPGTENAKEDGRPAPASAPTGDKVQSARDRLERARQALQAARDNPRDGDVQWIGKVGGGARPVQSDDYQKRIALLEETVRQAEEELGLAEKNR